MKKMRIPQLAILAALVIAGTGCLDIIQVNFFKEFEKPNLSPASIAAMSNEEAMATAQEVSDSGDADTYSDEEIAGLVAKIDVVISVSTDVNTLQEANVLAGNLILVHGGGDVVVDNFVSVLPKLMEAPPTSDDLLVIFKDVFGADTTEQEFVKMLTSLISAGDYYEALAAQLSGPGSFSPDINSGEVTQYAVLSILVKQTLSGVVLADLYNVLYNGGTAAQLESVATSFASFDMDTLGTNPDLAAIIDASGIGSLMGQ